LKEGDALASPSFFCGANYGLCVVVLYCLRRPYSFCACKKNMERKTGQRGARKAPSLETPLSAEKVMASCHIIKTETLVCFPRFPLRTLLLFGACSASRRLRLVVNVSEIFFRSRRRCEASRRTIAACRRPPIKAKRSFYPFGGQGVATPGRPLVTFRRYGKLPAGGN